jgi:hypothetical protein
VKWIALVVAVVLLVAAGAIEASVSAEQLSTQNTRPRLEAPGVMLTAGGLLASTLIYLVLGHLTASDAAAIRAGVVTGVLAGLIGGTVRALIISGAVAALVNRYAAVPDWFVPVALGIFVALSCAVSAIGGGAIAWTGRGLSRALRSRRPA